jgi:lantibiotic leader peptide-processing serine protease
VLCHSSPLLPPLARHRTGRHHQHRYLVVYRNGTIPGDAETLILSSGARLTQRNEHLGIAAVQSPLTQDDAITLRLLAAQPNVSYVLHDRIVSSIRLRLKPIATAPSATSTGSQSLNPAPIIGRLPTHSPIHPEAPHPPALPSPSQQPYDTYYTTTPQGWAVQQVGGYGNSIPGGPSHGPWDTTMGKGIRIAIIDSGVDQAHPDIAPNLVLNLSEIDQTAYPTTCDDGTPQDQ